jgi:hypothetical protein
MGLMPDVGAAQENTRLDCQNPLLALVIRCDKNAQFPQFQLPAVANG